MRSNELSRKLSKLRHNINNHLSLIIAAAELIRLRPETVTRMTETLMDQPQKITEEMKTFSAEFNQIFGLDGRPASPPPAATSNPSQLSSSDPSVSP